jgi:hypothetical protein
LAPGKENHGKDDNSRSYDRIGYYSGDLQQGTHYGRQTYARRVNLTPGQSQRALGGEVLWLCSGQHKKRPANNLISTEQKRRVSMSYFIVRIELHELNNRQKPTWEDYERLHAAMQQSNYFRVIQSAGGNWYHLPHATYFAHSNNMTKSEILSAVTAIVQAVWNKSGKLVTEGPSTWDGLVLASAEDVQRLAS